MRKTAGYYYFYSLVVLASTFGISPMAFCRMKPGNPQRSCCKSPYASNKHCSALKSGCPMCKYDLCNLDRNPADISVKPQSFSQNLIAILPHTSASQQLADFAITDYVIAYNDTSPPLYLELGILRL